MAGGEDGGEGQEESGDDGAEFFGDEAGSGGNETSGEEADGVLVGFGGFEGTEIDLNAHVI